MILPKTIVEKEEYAKGTGLVLGVDEAGRGPLAGPVVSAAVFVSPEFLEEDFTLRSLVRDSKKLSEKQRDQIYEFIMEDDMFSVGIGEVSHKMIDRLNILSATMLAMRVACEEAVKNSPSGFSSEKACVLVDGNKKIPGVEFEQRIFTKGDLRIFSIAAASIVAKVHRDRMMQEYHQEFPKYGFDKHKGYGTKDHMDRLKRFGPCEIHRKSFAPVARFYE